MAIALFDLFQRFGQSITPLHVVIVLVVILALKKLFGYRKPQTLPTNPYPGDSEEIMEPMKKRDFTLEELREYDGVRNNRVLIAVNGKVFDVSRAKNFYGPDGPYGRFAGHDASRGLATFSLEQDVLKDQHDDLSDLNSMQMDSLREWEFQFHEKYDLIGRLLKPDETHQTYEDETEDEDTKSLKKD